MALHLQILSSAKSLESAHESLLAQYQQRLLRFSLSLREIKISDSEKIHQVLGQYLEREKKKIPRTAVCLLHERGLHLTSTEFAGYLEKQESLSAQLILIIGPPMGWSAEILQAYPQQLSLSKMTFPHKLTTLILSEQIYRADTLLTNRTYHF